MSEQNENEGILSLGTARYKDESELQGVIVALAGQIVGELVSAREALEGIAENDYLRARVELAKSFITKSNTQTGFSFHVDQFEKCWGIVSGEQNEAQIIPK